MPDYSITAANVHAHEGARTTQPEKFGATMTAGQWAYYATAAQEWLLLDANLNLTNPKIAMVLVGAAEDGYGVLCLEGPVDMGTTLTSGVPVIASTTAGAAAPVNDWTGVPYASAWQYHLGYPTAADRLYIKAYKTGASVA